MTKKYAVDLISPCVILDKRTQREVTIDYINDETPYPGKLLLVGYFQDDGEEFNRLFDQDSIVRLVEMKPDDLLRRLILQLNRQYGSEWIRDLETDNFALWKDIATWQWKDFRKP